MKRFIAVLCVMLSLITLSGCIKEPEPPVIEDRVPIVFIPSGDIEATRSDMDTLVMNYLSCLVRGDYTTALEYVHRPNGVLFDADTLQYAALQDGIGRGDSVQFYSCESGEPEFNYLEKEVVGDDGDVQYVTTEPPSYGDTSARVVEYDLTLRGETQTVTKVINIITVDGKNYIDMSNHVSYGTLQFQVPKYVDVYLNGTLVPKTYMNSDYVYDISTGVPRSEDDTLKLTLKTKLGVAQDFPIFFQNSGQSDESSKSVNDTYYNDDLQLSSFRITVSRELRESALAYVQSEVYPRLMNDIVRGTAWNVASIQSQFREDSNIQSMGADFYARSEHFKFLTTADGESYAFQDVKCYNFNASDESAEAADMATRITDNNTLQFYTGFDYDFLYTKGTQAKGGDSRGSIRAICYLGKDDDGNWYVQDLSSEAYAIYVND